MQSSLFNISTNAMTGKMQIEPKYPDAPGYKEHTTSKDAAKRVRYSADALRQKIREMFDKHVRLTAKEATRIIYGYSSDVSQFLSDEINPVRSRMSELTAQGFLYKTEDEREGSKVYAKVLEGKG